MSTMEVVIDGSVVERVDKYKFLGVVIDNRLSWHDHLDELLKRLNTRMHCFRLLYKFHVNIEIHLCSIIR